MARQPSIVGPPSASGGRVTRGEASLDQTGSAVPWAGLVAIVDAKRPEAGRRGRRLWPTEALPRVFPARAWSNPSGEAAGGAAWGSPAVRGFVGSGDGVPDATTSLGSRHVAEGEGLGSRAGVLMAI